MSGYFRAPRDAWPAIAEALPHPWLDEWVELDCAYWAGEAEREAKGFRSALPMRGRRKLTGPWCAARWGWSAHHARKALRRYDPMRTLRSHSVNESSTQRERTERPKPHNGRKPFKNVNESSTQGERKSLRARSGADPRPQTPTTDSSPPYPPAGGDDLESAVRSAMADDPIGWSDERWVEEHRHRDLYRIADDEIAAEVLERMLAERPTEPMGLDALVATMWRQGWRGSGRGGRVTQADRRAIARYLRPDSVGEPSE